MSFKKLFFTEEWYYMFLGRNVLLNVVIVMYKYISFYILYLFLLIDLISWHLKIYILKDVKNIVIIIYLIFNMNFSNNILFFNIYLFSF